MPIPSQLAHFPLQSLALARAMCVTSVQTFPLRLWIVDNSGSMRQADGCRLVASSTKSRIKFAECTRWDELKDTVLYHAQLAALLVAPTQFMVCCCEHFFSLIIKVYIHAKHSQNSLLPSLHYSILYIVVESGQWVASNGYSRNGM